MEIKLEKVPKKGKEMDLKQALKRLRKLCRRRDVRVTPKDYEAVAIVTDHIIYIIPSRYHDCILPRGYYILTVDFDLGKHKFLCKDHFDWDYRRQEFERKRQYLNGGLYLYYGVYTWYPHPMPVTVIEFAKDLRTGLLTEIEEWLNEKITKEKDQVK